jgi:CDP-glycerol glycerophosphotransferase
VLYAPTWRDNQHTVGVGYTLELGVDFDELRSVLGDDYVVLFRPHYFIASVFDFEHHAGFVYDASRVDDISELYVVSDVLVTDYSSVFFDYANLRRPLVFHMYDLEDYTEDIRGFYLDLAELPGPIVKTTAELGRAILGSATRDEATLERYERFVARFAPLDDGHAGQRVLARVIGHPDGGRRAVSQRPDHSSPS